ncbi:MAG: haloacid dehalogenase-like hydrolase [Candidatus Marinimicrobia bacterium]|nr:haloacid dehalogenase-like hydrolase [Candidatus Neomarinimicrobiota bacterium]
MTICIFDIDNTLYRSSTVRSFLPYALREGAFPLKFFLALPFYLLRFFFRGVTPALLGKQFPLMQGISEQQMKAAAKITYQKKIRPGLDTVLLKEIEMQRKAGNKILLASSSFYPVIEPLLKELAPDAVIATDIDFENGRSSGIIRALPPFREGKKLRVLQYLESVGTSPDSCTFFTDHHDDLPLLNIIGRPIATNPTRRLRRIARERGWEILDTRNHRHKENCHD